MKLKNNNNCCAVILTTEDTRIFINAATILTVRKNSLVLVDCRDNTFSFSAINQQLVAWINKEVINAYLHFLQKEMSLIYQRGKQLPSCIVQPCRTPHIFAEAARLSQMTSLTEVERHRRQSLLFTVLSVFLPDASFLPLMGQMSQGNLRTQVSAIIQSDMARQWDLNSVASCLCISASVLKKRLRDENTSYSRIVNECRMRHAAELLTIYHKSITQASMLCGYSSNSYFISVFKKYYGMTPLNYVKGMPAVIHH